MKILETEAYIDTLVDMVDQGNEVLLVVVGHSMEPFLVHERDQVLLSPITREVRKGDIILYQREDGQYILHRICRIRADGYDLVGDNHSIIAIRIASDRLSVSYFSFRNSNSPFSILKVTFSLAKSTPPL